MSRYEEMDLPERRGVNQANEGSKNTSTTYENEVKRLSHLLKLYFHRAISWSEHKCSLHPIYCSVLLLQILKVIFITVQMFDFGDDHGHFMNEVDRGHITLRHLLLRGWDFRLETLSYPPSYGEFALYSIDDLEEAINFAVERYHNAGDEASGYYFLTPQDKMVIRIKYFDFPGFNDSTVKEDFIVKEIEIPVTKGLSKVTTAGVQRYKYDVRKEFVAQGLTQPFKGMLLITLHFDIHSVRMNEVGGRARCLRIEGWVKFMDQENNGQVVSNLETLTRRIFCNSVNISVTDLALENTNAGLGRTIITFSVVSLLVTVLRVVFAVYVFVTTKRFMQQHFEKYYKIPPNDKEIDKETDLPFDEYLKFISIWDMLVIVSDCCTMYGTIMIIFNTEAQEWLLATLDAYTVWLGLGCVLAWISILRFFRFSYTFHLLFFTIYRALWDVVLYLLCISVLFVGYWACGYVVLGPYHVKFKTAASTAETLFSVVNGDEIYVTLAILEKHKAGPEVIWFSKLYICSYVAIFTVLVMNLLIALFNSAYQTVKTHYDTNTKPEERDLGPLERAVRNFTKEQHKRPYARFQSFMFDLFTRSEDTISSEEKKLKTELDKLVTLSGQDVVVRPTTGTDTGRPLETAVRNFIKEHHERPYARFQSFMFDLFAGRENRISLVEDKLKTELDKLVTLSGQDVAVRPTNGTDPGLETAVSDFIAKHRRQNETEDITYARFRSLIRSLFTRKEDTISSVEGQLKTELGKLLTLSGPDLAVVKGRTLKAFMTEQKDNARIKDFGWLIVSILSISYSRSGDCEKDSG